MTLPEGARKINIYKTRIIWKSFLSSISTNGGNYILFVYKWLLPEYTTEIEGILIIMFSKFLSLFNLGMRAYKVQDLKRTKRVGVTAKTFTELVKKGCEKLEVGYFCLCL